MYQRTITEAHWNAIVALLEPGYPGITRDDIICALDGGTVGPVYITMKEACDIFRLSVTSLYRLERAGKIRMKRIGLRKVLVDRRQLEKYMEDEYENNARHRA